MAAPSGIQSLARSKKVKMAVYADPGDGKTVLAGSSPGKTLIIRPPVDHTDSIKTIRPDLKEWVINDWAEMNEALEYLRHEGSEWDWVWLDSLSLIQDVLLDDIWDTTIKEKPARARYGLDKQEYGINFFRLGQWMRHVVGPDLFNFGWTAHSSELPSPDLDEDGDPVLKQMPWVQGKNMSPKMCGYMNVVARIEVKGKGTRVLKATSTETHYGKDQFDAIPEAGIKLDRETGMHTVVAAIEKARPKARATNRRRSTATRRRTTTKGR